MTGDDPRPRSGRPEGRPDDRRGSGDSDPADGRDTEEEIDPLEGLMNPEEGVNSPASDADAPPPG